jgi:hypothetical protein
MMKKIGIVLLILALLGPSAVAQRDPVDRPGHAPMPDLGWRQPPPPQGPPYPGDTQDLLERVMLARMARELDLSDEQLVKIVRGLGEFRERLHALTLERSELMQALRASVGAQDAAQDAGATLDKLLALDGRLHEVRADMHGSLRGLLTPEQHAKVYLFLSEFDGQMKGLLDRARERGLVGPPPENPWPRFQELRDRGVPGPERPAMPSRPVPPERPDVSEGPEKSDAPDYEARRELLRKLMERRQSELRKEKDTSSDPN